MYVDCLIEEIKREKKTCISSIYFGGGTPSALSDEQLKRIFDALHDKFIVTKNIEVTLEINPEDVTLKRAQKWFFFGVNRFSLGVQSLDDQILNNLGRAHNRAIAKQAFQMLRDVGAKNISVDLISMLPGQRLNKFLSDLKTVLSWNPEHISLYALTIEKNSRLFVKDAKLPSEKMQEKYYRCAIEECEKHGLNHYEVSNFASRGFESQHNLNYWQGGDYFGFGMAAHAHHKGKRSWNVSRLMDYLNCIAAGNSAIEGQETLSKRERLIEALLFGLRMTAGVNIKSLQKKYGVSLDVERLKLIDAIVDAGLLIKDKEMLKVSGQGMLVLDEISCRLI